MPNNLFDAEVLKNDWMKKSAQDFVLGRIPQTDPIEIRGAWSKYLCGETPVNLPGNSEVSFRFERDIFEDLDTHRALRNQLFFSFVSPKNPKNVARFFLTEEGSNTYNLTHRQVDEKHRKMGVGSSLLKITEEWLHSVARISGESVTIVMRIGQPAVMKWALGNGYEVASGDRQLLGSILNEPKKFELGPLQGDMVPGDEYVYQKFDAEIDFEHPIRLNFKKVFAPNQ